MQTTRIAIIGLGSIGQHHAAYLAAGAVPYATLAAAVSINEAKSDAFRAKYPTVPVFQSRADLFDAKIADAVIIATPHYTHVPTALDAFANNLHVLVEKPLAVSISDARRLVDAYHAKFSHLRFAIMFNQRTNPLYQKMRSLIADGELGALSRVSWLITNWFRPDIYYKSSCGATWKGEGGGVLINQCPHNLDLLTWITGLMPHRVTAVASTGKFHPIEVDDELSAILEFPPTARHNNAAGPIGHFATTTGEFPGTNRLEIAGSRGKLTIENARLSFARSRTDTREFSRSATEPFSSPELWNIDFPPAAPLPNEHAALTADFVQVIRNNLPNTVLLAPAPEGLLSLELGNALLMSGLTRTPIDLPLNPTAYDHFLNTMAAKSQ